MRSSEYVVIRWYSKSIAAFNNIVKRIKIELIHFRTRYLNSYIQKAPTHTPKKIYRLLRWLLYLLLTQPRRFADLSPIPRCVCFPKDIYGLWCRIETVQATDQLHKEKMKQKRIPEYTRIVAFYWRQFLFWLILFEWRGIPKAFWLTCWTAWHYSEFEFHLDYYVYFRTREKYDHPYRPQAGAVEYTDCSSAEG